MTFHELHVTTWHYMASRDSTWHCVTLPDITWHYETLRDVTSHNVKLRDIVWHLVTICDIELTLPDIMWHYVLWHTEIPTYGFTDIQTYIQPERPTLEVRQGQRAGWELKDVKRSVMQFNVVQWGVILRPECSIQNQCWSMRIGD